MAWGGGSTGNGTVFAVGLGGSSPDLTNIVVLHSFKGGEDGALPYGSVTLSPDGKTLYGMTWQGGKSNSGVVFSLSLSAGAYRILHSFKGPKDGAYPIGSLTVTRGGKMLLGTTTGGGAYGGGTVFQIKL